MVMSTHRKLEIYRVFWVLPIVRVPLTQHDTIEPMEKLAVGLVIKSSISSIVKHENKRRSNYYFRQVHVLETTADADKGSLGRGSGWIFCFLHSFSI